MSEYGTSNASVPFEGAGSYKMTWPTAYMLETIEHVSSHMQRVPEDPPNTGRSNNQRERAHRAGKLTSPLNGEQPIFALLGYDDIRTLEGRLLTIVDATFGDPLQRKAFKDLVRNAIWFDWAPNLDTDDIHIGKPSLP